ncbi:MAG: TRAP transporter small permease subunit [Burkholderiales bacterium]|nr:TRAP transporter small permease subunit [Burkholderiales bacterium]
MMLRRFRARYGRLLEWLVGALPWGARRIVNIAAQLVVIAFFVVLGTVGVANMPILSGDSMVSLPWVPMNFVQSVIPVSSALIVIAEVAHLLELLAASVPP